jgi:hypothetical protein
MHHIVDREGVRWTLAEMLRVAKPRGRVLVWDHNPRNPYWGSLMARVPQNTGDERLVPERELAGGIEAAGGEVLLSLQSGLVPDFTWGGSSVRRPPSSRPPSGHPCFGASAPTMCSSL